MANMTENEIKVLRAIADLGGARFKDLAEKAGLSNQGLSKILRKLQRAGLIKREWDERGPPKYRMTEITPTKIFLQEVADFITSEQSRAKLIHEWPPTFLISSNIEAHTYTLNAVADELSYAVLSIAQLVDLRWQEYRLSQLPEAQRRIVEMYKKALIDFFKAHDKGRAKAEREAYRKLWKKALEKLPFKKIWQGRYDPSWLWIIDTVELAELAVQEWRNTPYFKEPDPKEIKRLRRILYNKRYRRIYESFRESLLKAPKGYLIIPLGITWLPYEETIRLRRILGLPLDPESETWLNRIRLLRAWAAPAKA